MSILLTALSSICFLVGLVCFILVVVQMFQHGKAGMGIATLILALCCGIGGLIALVVGWQNVDRWNIRTLMLVYSVVVAVNILLGAVNYAMNPAIIKIPQF